MAPHDDSLRQSMRRRCSGAYHRICPDSRRYATLAGDHFTTGDLGRVRQHGLELLVAHQAAATRVDSAPCSTVSNSPNELKTPWPASIK
jgi:hypothetical protein